MTVETHGLKFVIDSSQAAKGFRDMKSAVDGIFGSLDKFEAHVNKTMAAVERAATKKSGQQIAKAFEGLNKINIDGQAAGKLSALSAAMRDFRAPSSSQSANAKTFFKSIGTLPDLGKAYTTAKGIAALHQSMANFQAPSSAQAMRLKEFAKVLDAVKPNSRSISALSGLTAALSGLGGFRAPSPAQTRNLQAFVTAVGGIKVPPNAQAVARNLEQIATAANTANASLGRFRTNIGGFTPHYASFAAGTKHASVEMMGLQNAFSGTFQVGSLLRSLLGSLTIGELGREFFSAVQTANQFRASMEVLGATPMMTEAGWERVRASANHFGADLSTYAEGFSKFAVAAHESGMAIGDSFKVFEGFQTVMSVLHLGKEQQNSVGLAIREIMDRGYVSTQQLTRQLGLVLPGALSTLQKAWKETGKSSDNFFDALKKKEVDGKWALDQLSTHYAETYGPALAKALESPIQQFNILKNNIMDTMVAIGDAGPKKAFADLIKQFSGYIDPSKSKAFADGIGHALTDALNRASNALAVFHDHWDSLKGPLGTVLSLTGKWMILSATMSIGRSILTPLMALRTGLLGFSATMAGLGSSASRLSPVWATLTRGTVPLASGISRLNASGFAARGMFNALASTSSLAGVQFRLFQAAAVAPTAAMNTLRGAFNGVRAAGSGLLNLVGGPLGATLIGLGVIASSVASEIAGLAMNHAEAQRTVAAGRDIFLDNATLLGKSATNAMMARAGMSNFHDQVSAATTPVQSFAGVVGNLADQLFRAADAARAANIAKVQGQVTDLQTTINTRSQDTIEGATSAATRKHSSWKDFFNTGVHEIGVKANNWWDGGEDNTKAHQDVTAARRQLPQQQALLKQLQGESAEDFAKRTHMTDLYKTNGATDPIYHGVDGDGGKGADKAFNKLKTMETALDALMKKLDSGDSVAKIMDTWTQDIDKAGQTLLTKNGYLTFLSNLKTSAKTTGGEVSALASAMRNGMDPKVTKALADRFHMSIPDMIEKLKAAASEVDDKMKDALVKDYETKFKATIEGLKKLGQNDPIVKTKADFMDSMKTEAKDFLSADGFTKFAPVLKELTQDSITAGDATKRLADIMRSGGGNADYSADMMNKLADAVAAEATAQGIALSQAAREKDIIGNALRQEQESVNMKALSNKQQEVAAKLIEITNAALAKKQLLTETEIAQARTRIEQMQAQQSFLEKQKTLFENNGMRQYIGETKQVADTVSSLDHDTFKGLDDTLYNLGMTGKLSFKSMLDSIQSDIMHWASSGLTKQFMNVLNGGEKKVAAGKSPSLWGGLMKKITGTDANDAKAFKTNDERLGLDKSGFQYRTTPDGTLIVTTADGSLLGSGTPGAAGTDGINDPRLTDMFKDAPDSLVKNMDTASTKIAKDFGTAMNNPVQFLSNQLTSLLSGKGGGGGMGGMMSGLGSLFGGGGGGGGGLSTLFSSAGMGGGDVSSMFDMSSMTSMLGGFKEGGMSNAPVGYFPASPSSFRNAPHYAEGTANTSGIPAVLHDNEAVIPLSRGRKVPVTLTNNDSQSNSGGVNVTFNVQSPDADSFRKSRSQLATEAYAVGMRAYQRNN